MRTRKPTRARKNAAAGAEVVHDGSGNVFADLGLPNPEEQQAKADLAHQIGRLIKAAALDQRAAAAKLGIDQPKVSALLRGKLKDFSTERLMKFITALDHDVVITIRKPRDGTDSGGRVRVVA
jgi:predicted XRE-type DNA-binding protein